MRYATAFVAVLALAGCSPELDWRELKSDAGRFAVLMPAKFQHDSRTLAASPGAAMHLWSARAADSVFGVGYTDYPAGTAVSIERTAQDLAGNISGRITGSGEVRVGERASGVRFSAEGMLAGQPHVLHARLLQSDGRLYQLVVIAPKGRIDAAELEMFFDSFKLLP
ncbi:MAG: hypothetical protein WA373_03515 [Burkholderiales bacterium]